MLHIASLCHIKWANIVLWLFFDKITMDCAPNVNIFRELQVVHDTGYFSSQVSPEEDWQQVINHLFVCLSVFMNDFLFVCCFFVCFIKDSGPLHIVHTHFGARIVISYCLKNYKIKLYERDCYLFSLIC